MQMNKATFVAFALFALQAGDAVCEEPKIVSRPLSVGALQEFGYVVDGLYNAGGQNSVISRMEWVDHLGAFLTKEAVVNDRLFLSAGLGGIFQFRKPETVGLGFLYHQRKAFFIGPTKAEAVYHLGDPENPWLKLGTGMFPYKYNPDAVNLGEYLFRAGAYPTYSFTGGYAIVGNAGAQLEGFKANFQAGDFRADILLFTETTLAPLYDWSLGAVAEYTLGGGLLDIGAGVNFQHLLQVKPSRTARRLNKNSYFTYNGKDYTGYSDYYNYPAAYYTAKADALEASLGTAATQADSARIQGQVDGFRAAAAPYAADGALVDILLNLPETDPGRPKLDHYSAAAVLLMARFSLDVKKLFDTDAFGPQDLKLYGEVNLLGVKNYPILYADRKARMPIMVGFNLPGFKLLDLIALQAEYQKSPWLNNTYQRGTASINLPYLPNSTDAVMSKVDYFDMKHKDDFKWSILLRKSLHRNVSLSAQFASDHLRLTSSQFYYGPQFDHNEVTAFENQWYWMTQLSWGI
jgi:hypothetical protein